MPNPIFSLMNKPGCQSELNFQVIKNWLLMLQIINMAAFVVPVAFLYYCFGQQIKLASKKKNEIHWEQKGNGTFFH